MSIRDLRLQPGTVWQDLRTEEALVLTSDGRPMALLVNVSDADVDETLAALR